VELDRVANSEVERETDKSGRTTPGQIGIQLRGCHELAPPHGWGSGIRLSCHVVAKPTRRFLRGLVAAALRPTIGLATPRLSSYSTPWSAICCWAPRAPFGRVSNLPARVSRGQAARPRTRSFRESAARGERSAGSRHGGQGRKRLVAFM